MYALWYFATSFLLSIVITRGLNNVDFGIYTVLTTIIGTITFICAIGLEDTATVFLLRIFTNDGSAATGTLIRRLLVTRVLIIGVVGLGIAVGLIVAAPNLGHFGICTRPRAGRQDSAPFSSLCILLEIVFPRCKALSFLLSSNRGRF